MPTSWNVFSLKLSRRTFDKILLSILQGKMHRHRPVWQSCHQFNSKRDCLRLLTASSRLCFAHARFYSDQKSEFKHVCVHRQRNTIPIRQLHVSAARRHDLYHPEDPTGDFRSVNKRVIGLFHEQTTTYWNGVLRGNMTHNQWRNRFIPNFCDILVVGGGIMGSAVAYCLKQTMEKPFLIVVLDKDMSFTNSQTVNAMGTIRTQYSVAEHVRMSLYTAQFLREFRTRLNLRHVLPRDINFTPQGFLFLGTPADQAQMEKTHDLQITSGAHVALMQSEQLNAKFPWLNVEGIALASYGIENEGWYDPWSLLVALRDKNLSRGVYYVHGELVDLVTKEGQFGVPHFVGVSGVQVPPDKFKSWVKLPNGVLHPLTYSTIVNAAGCSAKEIAEMNGIGVGRGLMSIPLPIERRKRIVFTFQCPEGPGVDMPILVDPIGYHVRREGLTGTYMVSPLMTENDQEPDPSRATSSEQHELYFNNVLWPKLAYRIPAFKRVKYCGAWDNFIDWNYFDNSAITGPHPYAWNHYFALPGSGNALSVALGVGRGIEEMIYDSLYMNVDLEKFHFTRFLNYEPVKERLVL